MKRSMTFLTAVCLATLAPAIGQAQNLLTNGGLNELDVDGNPNPFVWYSIPVGWTLSDDPCSVYPCNPTDGYYEILVEPYAEHSNPGGDNTHGIVFNSPNGNFPGYPNVPTVDAEFKQSVPGTPGLMYQMTGWAYFEAGYSGGVDVIDPNSPQPRAGLPSLTDTFFALEFLDASDAVLPGSLVYELHDDLGQQNDPNEQDGRDWVQHILTAVAPAGTAKVQVRVTMIDGEFNIDPPDQHQAAWFDDFTLTVVPEPTTGVLALLGWAMIAAVRRQR